ncbi:hypothetical protein ACUOFC_07180, partial [Escherichia sp. TWPC-MK]
MPKPVRRNFVPAPN